ncbi:MAG: ABC transporter ATP-binding protein/permease [bacterium]|nr:ABC transporter ATP-binding protein/permease [bacterium]
MASTESSETQRPGRLKRAFGRPLRLLWRHRLPVLLGMSLVPVHAAVTLWMPGLIGRTLDLLTAAAQAPPDPDTSTIATSDPETLAAGYGDLRAACLVLLALGLAEAVSRFVSRRLLIDVSRHVEEDLKNDLVAHLQRLPMTWFDRSRTGDLVSRLTQDAELVRFVMGPLLLHGGNALCVLPAGAWLMASMNVPVTLAAAGVFGLLLFAFRSVMPRLHKWSKKSQEAVGEISQQAQEDFAGIRVVHQFARVERERAAMATKNRRYLLANLRLVRLRSLLNALTHTTSGAVLLTVLAVGGYEAIAGRITVGELFQFIGYLALMTFPLEVLGWTIAMLPRAYAGANRIAELFEVEPEPNTGAAPELTGRIRVENLTFTYPEAERPALADVSFTLEPGQKLGLVGPVGAGKSTLLALLMRLYDPPRGTIFLDDHDLLDLEPEIVRRRFALAAQEPFLFSDTIANNVAFGDAAAPAPGDAAAPAGDLIPSTLDAAVGAAALDQDLPQFRDGLSTLVGERGVTLSGGQKQRVSLARALLSDRPGLLLDDTLSAVDPGTEQRILRGLETARRDRTVIAASHRLSVVADADLILVFDAGQVRERGTHEQLLAGAGRYAAAWQLQAESDALESNDPGGDGEEGAA